MAEDGTTNLILNILPFHHPEKTKTFGFYSDKTKGKGVLNRREFPEELKDKLPDAERLYTDFSGPEEAELQQAINLESSKFFAGHYYNYLLYNAMRGRAAYRRRNFINDNEFWFREQAADKSGLWTYKRFTAKASVGRYINGPGLQVSFMGRSYVLQQPVLRCDLPSTAFNHVLYKGHCFRYNDIPEDFDIDMRKVYAVLNRDIAHYLTKPMPRYKEKNKIKACYNQIEWFKNKHLLSNEIQPIMPAKNDGNWMPVSNKQVFKTARASNKLIFFNGNTHKQPKYGIKKYGPYKRPKDAHFQVFFIMHENHVGSGRRLYKILNGNTNIKGLKQYTNLPLDVTNEQIFFKNADNPYPEIKEQLVEMSLKDDMRYLAVYISPISKEEQNDEKYRAYFRIKEELLKYGIASQVINHKNIGDSNFRFYMPNIAVAVLAKLGGVPWQLDTPPRPELIVGVGAYKPREMDNRYVGNAFCFSNQGEFYGFECYVEDETTMLAGSIREAVHKYVKEQGGVERLIIHYYKQMSYKERQPIVNTLNNLGLDIPVIVVTIPRGESKYVTAFDASNPEKIPLSGINIRLSRRTHLLCNNTRYNKRSKNLNSYPFPVKLQIDTSSEDDDIDGPKRAQLIRQVYQFSRIYWKSVSQQPLPVTVSYPRMVAEMIPYFESLEIPDFGKKSLWFL